MAEYAYAKDRAGTVNVTFDAEQFGDVELFGAIMQFKEIGKDMWDKIGVGGSITACPTTYNGKVFFGACDKNFYAVDAETGKEVWRFQTEGIVRDEEGCAFRDGFVYFCSDDGRLYAVEAETGTLAWKFRADGHIMGDPTIEGGIVYFSSTAGCVYAVNADDGSLAWKRNLNSDVYMVVPHNGRLYGGWKNDTFFCMDRSGNVLWRFFTRNNVSAWPPAFSDRFIYFGSWDHNLYCIDYDGKLVWRFKAGDATYRPVLRGNRLYFGSRDGCAYCINASNGSLIWKFKTNGWVVNVYEQGGRVYFGSWDNNAYCVDAETGRKIWVFPTNGFVNVGLSEGRLYAGSWDCNLYCLDINTGELFWRFATSISTPSKVEPPEATATISSEVIWVPEKEAAREKYSNTPGGDYDMNISQYGAMDKSYVSSRKRGYIK